LSNEPVKNIKGGKTMVKALLVFLVLVIPALACAHIAPGNVVDVRVVSEDGVEFARYKTYPRLGQQASYFYVEAVKGGRYSIQVTNRTGRRIGVVIAVDGRNIISGKKSDLKPNERMYIIRPYETNILEGWRTGMDRTNRFYFTEPSDSYAEKVFTDDSAMGTIAVAAYGEKVSDVPLCSQKPSRLNEAPPGAATPAPRESPSANGPEQKKDKEAGTGFGETTYSPAQRVQFEPEHTPADKVVLKYEWRSELCRKGIINCGPRNRFWPGDSDFVPIPKGFNG
jgi:hypothetical protein